MKRLIINSIIFFEILLIPFIILSALVLKLYRRVGSGRLKVSTNILKKIGVFPINDHYYEPLFNDAHLSSDLSAPRKLPGIDFQIEKQLTFLESLNFQKEFDDFLEEDKHKSDKGAFKFKNGSFESGDAEFLYNLVRRIKPKKVIEIGCGNSTKIISKALKINKNVDGQLCSHTCIEPYEQTWLEQFPEIELLREKVETVDLSRFENLEAGDLLFIDSSHMIRPQGDVLHEYLTIIPSLPKGVFIHVHDIFSPHDYLSTWVKDKVLFWNEQYLLEALLSKNSSFEVVAALNLLMRNHPDKLKQVCPHLTPDREPGSFYFKTV